jgi:hypothetical protein
MEEKQRVLALKQVAASRPAFFLSEVLLCLDNPLSVQELFSSISSQLPALGLTAKKTGDDFEMTRIALQSYFLNHEETERQDAFFAAGEIPAIVARSIENYISKKTGKEWCDPVIIERLRRAIVTQKDDYWKPAHKRSLRYTKGYSILGYLAYHFPVYFMQTEYLLMMLARENLLKKNMTILDVGTGPGVVPLAIADFYSRLTKHGRLSGLLSDLKNILKRS